MTRVALHTPRRIGHDASVRDQTALRNAQDILATQQLNRNTQLFQTNAVAQRVLEASRTEARQTNILVAERRQMLRLSGLWDEAIAKLSSEAAINATSSVAAPRSATVD